MTPGATDPTPLDRAAALAALGHAEPSARPALTNEESASVRAAAESDPDARVRAAAVAALVRAGVAEDARRAWSAALDDDAPAVRRRAAETAPALLARGADGEGVGPALVARLHDVDVTVVEAAAWALGEEPDVATRAGAVGALADVATTHDDPIAREAAVAALGAIGDRDGLPAILRATRDKPAVRRRAVLALAPFDGDEVDAALRRARDDRDWQVRQAAEDLLPEAARQEDLLPEAARQDD